MIAVNRGDPAQEAALGDRTTDPRIADVEHRLRLAEERALRWCRAGGEAIAVVDEGGVIVEVNPALCELLGYAEPELVGTALAERWAPGGAMLVRKDGSSVVVDVARATTTYLGRPATITRVRERTGPALDEVRRHAERMQVLYEASHAFARDVGDPDRLVQAVARTCSALVGDFTSVTLVDDDGEWLYQAAVHHPDPELERAYRAIASTTRVRLGEGVMGKVLLEDRPLLLPEVDPEAIVARAPEAYKEAARRLNVCSFVGVPMHARGRVIGGISLARSRTGASYVAADVAYLQDLADRAALAVENARLYASLERRVAEATAQLNAANQQLLESNAKLGLEVVEHRATAQALRYSRDRAEGASRELEAFSYSVAHDLRAPLRSIDGFSQAILEDSWDRLDADARAHLARVRAAAQRMGALIDDLLNLSRVSRAELRRDRVDLSALARAVLARLRDAHPERCVEAVVEPGVIVDADPRLLEVALGNLLDNAWKFTSRCPDARIELAVERGEGPPIYVVRDNGAGFDPTYVGKLFGVFQRLHASHEYEGTGVGLATVQRIIRLHGGRIWAEGALGQGATFSFTLEEDHR